jgi:hypothetical protein
MIRCWTYEKQGRRKVRVPLSPIVVANLPQKGMWLEHKSGVIFKIAHVGKNLLRTDRIEELEQIEVAVRAFKEDRKGRLRPFKEKYEWVGKFRQWRGWILKRHMRGWGV